MASLFISRWDSAVTGKVPMELNNQLGIAMANPTYTTYRELPAPSRWQRAFNAGRRQRLLWASTGMKDSIWRKLLLAVVAGTAMTWFGLDTDLLDHQFSANTNNLEQRLIAILRNARESGRSSATPAASPTPMLSGPLTSLLGASQWLNTQPLQPSDLRGKVVLVNFWTYSCINCLRMLPHVKAWAEKYKDHGLVVIGVETPEFTFEKDLVNVRTALVSLGVSYPVVTDNDYKLWRAFDNQAWPALYFIDADGRVRQHVFGEGGYDQSEKLIQKLLSEANGTPVSMDIVATSGKGVQAAADERDLGSAETYVGYEQARNFDSTGGIKENVPKDYRTPSTLPINQWSLAGIWTVGSEFASPLEATGSIVYHFHARDLHLVLAPPADGHPIRFRIRIDGAPPGANHGFDVDLDGWGSVREARLYQLIRQAGPVVDRSFEIEFFGAGVRVYDFTFG
jgi:thiol-disulfide isomerase/thioredoxin